VMIAHGVMIIHGVTMTHGVTIVHSGAGNTVCGAPPWLRCGAGTHCGVVL
jgi:hypothetical protein